MSHFDKMPEPQRRHEPRRADQRSICWCGDPRCDGGLRGPAPSSTGSNPYSSGRRDSMANIDFNDIERLARNLRGPDYDRMMRDLMLGGWGSKPSGVRDAYMSVEQPTAPKEPPAYTKAREAVKDYLLDVNPDTAWDDVVGNDDARAALVQAIEEPKLNPELYAFYGMTPPKGVLLFGPPGCGKTMFAKAAAAAVSRVYGAKAEVLVINGPSIQSPYIGKTEEIIRAIFAYAREYQKKNKHPLTVFFDEAEVLFPDRTGRTRKVFSYEESNVAQFLSEMDGLNACGAFVILATNRPEAIDEALLRDGRCDRKIKVSRPTREAVEHIVRKSLADAPMASGLEDLVVAAVESFFNPHYVIREGAVVRGMIDDAGQAKIKSDAVNFCLEHIVSGAMAAGVSRRARSSAFLRDRDSGKREGIQVQDVVDAVKQIFEENRTLEHSFALREFVDGLKS